jgi:hypothetical protein
MTFLLHTGIGKWGEKFGKSMSKFGKHLSKSLTGIGKSITSGKNFLPARFSYAAMSKWFRSLL